MNELSLVFDGPAGAWNEALPLGNGSMGAMSYGWLREEKIELNLDTLWSGTGRSKENKNTDVDWDIWCLMTDTLSQHHLRRRKIHLQPRITVSIV